MNASDVRLHPDCLEGKQQIEIKLSAYGERGEGARRFLWHALTAAHIFRCDQCGGFCCLDDMDDDRAIIDLDEEER